MRLVFVVKIKSLSSRIMVMNKQIDLQYRIHQKYVTTNS